MKNYGWIIFFLLFALYFALKDCRGITLSSEQRISGSESSSNTLLRDLMNKEPKVKDYVLTDANVFYVSVFDDGTRRDGYAEYMCNLLKANKLKVHRVKVIKVNSSRDPKRDNAYGILLGEAWCK